MGILSGNPQDEPLHYGEVFGTWSYLAVSKGGLVALQTFNNHAGDKDLKNLITTSIEEAKKEIQQLEDLLKTNGVALPPTAPDRPVATLEDIPVGARFNDPEISAAIALNLAAALVACSQMMGQSIREDIGTLFAQFHMQKAQLGAKFLKIEKEKGWLIPPPLHMTPSK